MNAVKLRDLSDLLARAGVHHFYQGGVRSVNPVRVGVHRDVVPTARAANLDLVEDLISFARESRDNHHTSCDQKLLHHKFAPLINLIPTSDVKANGRSHYQ